MPSAVGRAGLMTPQTRRDALRRTFLHAFAWSARPAFQELLSIFDTHALQLATLYRARNRPDDIPERGLAQWPNAVRYLRAQRSQPLEWEVALSLVAEPTPELPAVTRTEMDDVIGRPLAAVQAWARTRHIDHEWFLAAVWRNLTWTWPSNSGAPPLMLSTFRMENVDLPHNDVEAVLGQVGTLQWDPTRQTEDAFRADVEAHIQTARQAFERRWPGLKERPRKDHKHVGWLLRYQVLERPSSEIAKFAGVSTEAVTIAIRRLATQLELPLRPGRRPGRRVSGSA